MIRLNRIAPVVCALMTGGLASFALPAIAQSNVEELVVTGHIGQVPSSTRTLSRPVSYADLDLSTDVGRHQLRQRVSLTARWLCDKLGESGSGDALAPSCRDATVKDALARAGTLEQGFAPRGTTWVAGPAWATPYPAEWTAKYPD
jgi:UrcA family protein